MILERLFQKAGIGILKKGMEAASQRHETIASNIANVGTPGYQRRQVQFEEKLKESLQGKSINGRKTDPRHIPVGRAKANVVTPDINVDDNNELASGINNVDVDQEMADLAKNQIYFSANATLMARKFRGLKSAIRGRSSG